MKTNTTYYQYIHTDHLGSIVAITDKDKNVVDRRSYDAWGKLRNYTTFSTTNIQPMQVTARGYTMHEHIACVSLINMNGRMYDPTLGRMLSPDNYIQSPTNTQSFNRYAYAFNNPLSFTDPSGNQSFSGWGDQNHHSVQMGVGGRSYWDPFYTLARQEAFQSQMERSILNQYNYDYEWERQKGFWSKQEAIEYYANNSQYYQGKRIEFGDNGDVTIGDYVPVYHNYSLGVNPDPYYSPLVTKRELVGYRMASNNAQGGVGGFLDNGLDYAGKTNDAIDAFAKTLGTNGLTAVMVSGGKTIGRYSGPAGIVINTGQVFNGVRKDGFTYGYNAQKATAGAVGGIAGAWAGFQVGAWAGLEAGFTIGLAFEGVGAIPGAVIGGIVGGFGGAWGGAYGGSKLGESLIGN